MQSSPSSNHPASGEPRGARGSLSIRRHAAAAWLLLPLAVTAVLSALVARGAFLPLDLRLRSFLYRTSAEGRPLPPVTVVAIDDASLDRLGLFPFRRTAYADLLTALAPDDRRPGVLVLDIGFFDAPQDEAATADLAAFAAALDAAAMPVVLAAKVEESGTRIRRPLPELAAGVPGFANVHLDPDGVVRRVPTSSADPGIRGLAVETVRQYFGVADPPRLEEGRYVLSERKWARLSDGRRLPPVTIPVDDSGAFAVNYLGPPGTVPTIPLLAVLDGVADPALLKDRVVLVGATTLDLHDYFLTPGLAHGNMAGVEVQANAVATILTQSFLVPPRAPMTLLLLLLASFLAAWCARRLAVRRGLVAAAGILLALFLLSAGAFSFSAIGRPGYLLDLAAPLTGAMLSYVLVLLLRLSTEEKEKRFLRRAFDQYVSPAVVAEIAADPERLALGGARKELTILFSDIRGFTTLSERLTPEELVRLLNRYFDVMTDAILGREGVIDKFIGDAIMAFWGAPLPDERHAVHACEAALLMRRRLDAFNAELAREDIPPVAIGIGLNTGPVVVGNMGSSKRFDYTVMGDAVNLASRLEGLTKPYHVVTLVGEETRRQAEDAFLFRTVDRVRVKGKLDAVTVSEVIAPREDAASHVWLAAYEASLDAYFRQDWTTARRGFERLRNEHPDDGLLPLLLERIAAFEQTPPPKDWDGVTAFTTK